MKKDTFVQAGFVLGGLVGCIAGLFGIFDSVHHDTIYLHPLFTSIFVLLLGCVAVSVFFFGHDSTLSWFGLLHSYLGAGLYFIFLGLLSLWGSTLQQVFAYITIGVGALSALFWVLTRPGSTPTSRLEYARL